MNSIREGIYSSIDYGVTLFNNNRHEIEIIKHVSLRVAKIALPIIVLLSSIYLALERFSDKKDASKNETITQSDLNRSYEKGKIEERKTSAYGFIPSIRQNELQKEFIDANQIQGIEITEKNPKYSAPFTATWSKTAQPQSVNKKHFLEPIGCVSLIIKADQLPDKGLISSILSRPHQINRLVLENFSEKVIVNAMISASLPKLDTLVINGTQISEKGLQKIQEKHKRIACFDIPKSSASSMKKSYLVRDQNGDNFDELYAKMNTFLQDLIEGDLTQLLNCFPSSGELPFLHRSGAEQEIFPAARFVTSLTCFRESDIGTATLKTLFSRLQSCCPHLNNLDLSNCSNITFEILSALSNIKLKRLSLKGCQNLYNKWSSREKEYVDDNARCKSAFIKFFAANVELLDISKNPPPLFSTPLQVASLAVPSKRIIIEKDKKPHIIHRGSIKCQTSADSGNEDLPKAGVVSPT